MTLSPHRTALSAPSALSTSSGGFALTAGPRADFPLDNGLFRSPENSIHTVCSDVDVDVGDVGGGAAK